MIVNALIRLSGPIILMRLLVPLRGFLLTAIFAALGANAIAAGALALSLLVVVWTFFIGVLTASLGVSIAYGVGAQRMQKIHESLHNGLWLGVLMSIPVMVFLYFSGPILLYFGQENEIALQASYCVHGLAWTLIPSCILISANFLFTNLKRPHVPMLYGIGSLLLTVFLGVGLSLGKFGLPKMGIAGVGWGMAIAQWTQVFVLMIHLRCHPKTNTFIQFNWLSIPKIKILFDFWKQGWPVGLKYCMEFFLLFLVAVLLGAFNRTQLPVYQVILQCFMLTSCLASGVGMSMVVLLGQAIGAGQYAVAIKTCFSGLLLGVSLIGVVSLMIGLFPGWLAHYFFPQGSVSFKLFVATIGWVVSFQCLDGIRKIIRSILMTWRDVRFPLLSDVIGLWLIALPLAYVMVMVKGLEGVLMSLIAGLLISTMMMCYRFAYRLRRSAPFLMEY